jgi:hypothetical protein
MLIGFNTSIFNALYILAFPGCVAFGAVISQAQHQKQWHYFFDPKHNDSDSLKKEGGTFEVHWTHYQGLAKLCIALSSGALAFLINTLANQHQPLTDFNMKLTEVAPIVVGFFGSTVFFLILFQTWMAYCYEVYCHRERHDSYKAWMHGTTVSLGTMGFIAFILGFTWLGFNLFR